MVVSTFQRSWIVVGLVVCASAVSGCRKSEEIHRGREAARAICRYQPQARNLIFLTNCERAVDLGATRAGRRGSTVRYLLNPSGTLTAEGQRVRTECLRQASAAGTQDFGGCELGIQALEGVVVERTPSLLDELRRSFQSTPSSSAPVPHSGGGQSSSPNYDNYPVAGE